MVQNKRKRLSAGETAAWAALVLPLSVCALWPVAEVFAQSIIRGGHLDLSGWTRLARDPDLLVRSVGVAAGATLATLPPALALALYMVYGKPGRLFSRLINATTVLSLVSPPFVGAMAFIMLFGKNGFITSRLLGLVWSPYGAHGIIIMQAISQFALCSILLRTSLGGVNRQLEDAARNLGASPGQTLVRVSLPLAAPGIAAAALIVFTRAMSDFSTPLFVGGSFQVLASRSYMALIHQGDFQLSGAMNVLLLAPALLCLWLARRFSGGGGATPGRLSARAALPLGRGLKALCLFCVWGFLLVQLSLYCVIVCGSFTATWGVDFTPTLRHVRSLLDFNSGSIARSLFCSLAAGLGASLVGMLAAWMWRSKRRASPAILHKGAALALQLPFVLPGTFLGLGYLLAYSRVPFEVSTGVLIAANCLVRQLSPAYHAGVAGLAGISPVLEDAGRNLGAGPRVVFSRIIAPLLRPSAVYAFVNAFSAAMVSTGPIIFLITPYARVMSVDMFESIASGKFGAANAMALAILLLVALVNGGAFWLAGRHGGRGRPA